MSTDITKARQQLEDAISARLAASCPKSVQHFAQQLREQYPGSLAILFYGSALRTGEIEATLLDFYVLVEGYRHAHQNALSATANALIPPNVYYQEAEAYPQQESPTKSILRAKVAVLSLKDFAKRCSMHSLDVSIWARFAQPSALLWVKDAQTRQKVVHIIGQAITTALSSIPRHADVKQWWAAIFANTYRCELRAERAHKPGEIVALFSDYYQEITPLAQPLVAEGRQNSSWWARRRAYGRVLHVLRLLKAAFTFAGGMDYLAWKIERHSGQKIILKPWHRHFPLIAGPLLAWQLKRRGAIR